MRYRWYYYKQIIRMYRPFFAAVAAAVLLVLAAVWGRERIIRLGVGLFRDYGVPAAGNLMKEWFPAIREKRPGLFPISYLNELFGQPLSPGDPAYGNAADRAFLERFEEENRNVSENSINTEYENIQKKENTDPLKEETDGEGNAAGETIAIKPSGSGVVKEKLADYDYLMKTFYTVHPTTTAGRDLMDAEKFLSMDFSIEKTPDRPQILIYHTHSQEEFSDYPENPGATIVGVGTYLKELLEQKGYNVIHDTSVYDLQNGELDRSQAYTYALDGISGILQTYPSIEVVLDIHRDGVASGTHLITEVNGKPTAQIMFFNGISQTPDGPIEYLPNPNREANLGFSFQLKLAAADRYPGFTRPIYLKGLRYNQHVRARSALIEVGAQTNTYDEAKNAMEPLAEVLDEVLGGRSKNTENNNIEMQYDKKQ